LIDSQRTPIPNKTNLPSIPKANRPKTPKRATRPPPKSDPPNPRPMTATTNNGTQKNEKS
jgi:hypothetical protein